ncbi:MAG: hypothetical protein NWQ53_11360, partial [Flavobacteriales bacterium]|nr:hypothetical protein [Flavobacteriales bacterium]
MEKHQHNIAFEEHHWDEALAVLKREERKQAMRRCAIFIPLGFAVFFGVIALLMTATPEAKHVSKIASNVGQSIKSSSGFVDGENDPLEGPNNSFAEDLIEEQINSITITDGLVKSNTTRERSFDKSATNVKEKSAATTADEESLSHKNELGLDKSFGLFETTPRLNQTTNSILEVSKESEQFTPTYNSSSFAMDKLDFKPISQSWRPGLKCKFATLNKRQQEFRKWSLQPQQWMFYVGNAFTNDYASRANAFAFNPQLGFAFEQHIAAKTYFRIGLG